MTHFLTLTLNLLKTQMGYCLFFFLSFLLSHGFAASCPNQEITRDHFLTQNKYGNSSYRDNSSLIILKMIIKNFDIKSIHSVLDVGAGYGSFAFNAIKSGVSRIYINDLSIENIQCIQASLKSLELKDASIQYLHGDINQKRVFEKIPDNSLDLINAVNVIHFFTFKDIFDFIKISQHKLKENGYLSDIPHPKTYFTQLFFWLKTEHPKIFLLLVFGISGFIFESLNDAS